MIGKRFTRALGIGTALSTVLLSALPAAAQQSIESLQEQLEMLQNQIMELTAAQQKQASSAPDFKIKWKPAPTISSADGRFEMGIKGRMFFDTAWVDDADNTESVRAAKFRLARLGVAGKAWNNLKYNFEVDFAGDKTSIKDATIGYDLGLTTVQIGHFKTFNSLDEQTSDTYTTFMERATGNAAFGLTRQMGIAVLAGDKTWSASAGAFRGAQSDTANDTGQTFAARLTYGPKVGDGLVHMGVSYRHRNKGADQGAYSYSTAPFTSFGTKFVNTGALAKTDNLFGAELAGVYGPFSVQGEYMTLKAKRLTPAVGFGDPSFQSYYVDASWFITGESRPYEGKSGTFGRVKPKSPAYNGGWGAWQVAARYDVTNLTDENIFGGDQKTWIVGLNWYLNDWSRLMANYSRAKITDGPNSLTTNGPDRANKVNAVMLRAQVDW
ncbi:porin [Govanella unica]|uniref:OprO/OprP family phosphate-selective porin n=1 Tax=Govanella unica TaxID=2975056 RepID=A0A9X3TWB9_9PROT|nr:porin [Govania unica]MDA5193146.1 OprO/OprP family phosphate-selective porin [Govania unica]